MENQELIILQSPKLGFEEVLKEFENYVKKEFTHPVSGEFYTEEAAQLLVNLKEIISQKPVYLDVLSQKDTQINQVFINVLDIVSENEEAEKVLSNQKIMTGVKEIMLRPDFLDDKGNFNIKCIFSYMSESHNMDLMGAIPAKFRTMLSFVGL